MKRPVSRFTDSLPCTKCGKEPRRPGQRWGNHCFAEYNRHQRQMDALEKAAGFVKMKLSPEEWELLKALRGHPSADPELIRELQAQPAGKHHAPAN